MIIVDRFRDSIIFVQNTHTKFAEFMNFKCIFSMLMLMLVCLHEVVHKILISSFQLQEGRNRKTILLAKVTSTSSIIGPPLHVCDTVVTLTLFYIRGEQIHPRLIKLCAVSRFDVQTTSNLLTTKTNMSFTCVSNFRSWNWISTEI